MSGGLRKASGNLSKFESRTSRVGASLGRLGGAMAKIGTVAAVGIGVGIAAGVRGGIESLVELEDATTTVDGAIATMGLTGKVTSAQIAAWANDIETDVQAAFDDKAITAATGTLLRYGKLAPKNIQPAMEVMTDLAARTGSVESASTLLAKALADPTKAAGKLSRQGIILTKAQQKQIAAFVKAGKVGEAQAVILGAVEKQTKGAAAAMNGPGRDALNQLQDAGEDVQRALATGFLPVLKDVAKWLNDELAKPSTIDSIRDFGSALAGGFRDALSWAQQLPWDKIKSGLSTAAGLAKDLIGAFTSLPPEAQATIVALAGLNKLSGGAVTGIVSELGKGLIKGVLGMTAAVVNLRAGTVVGPGGGPGGGVPPVAAPPGGGSPPASGVVTPAIGAAVVLSKEQLFGGVASIVRDLGVVDPKRIDDLNTAVDQGFTRLQAAIDAGTTGTSRGLDQVDASTDWIGKLTGEVKTAATTTATKVEAGTNATGTRLTALSAATTSGLGGVKSTQAASNSLLSSINAKDWSPTINIPLTVRTSVSVRNSRVATATSARYGGEGRIYEP
jgi:hypothetical protein